MVNLVRIYVFKQGVSDVIDVPRSEARERRKKLEHEGWTVTHTVNI